ncbi:MAG: ATP-binding protein [Fimbriimonadaceae bacterium]|nr:ATP-binding protein [Fimbriimonadaceae bacterium]QYK55070.1 MAG: ATP-binding protein [Fimbriimonadaceae bacterium]
MGELRPSNYLTATAGLVVLAVLSGWLLVGRVTGPVLVGVLTVLLGLAGTAAALAFRGLREAEDLAQSVEARSNVLEVEIQRSRDALDDLADGLDVMIFLTDADGQIRYANEAAVAAFGFEDPQGQSILAVTLSRELNDLIAEAARTDRPQRAEIAFRHPVERVGVARVWKEGASQPRYFVSVYDITDVRRLERVRRDFVANVSHELRTPMTTIRAMAETVQDELPATDPSQRYLTKVLKEVDRLTALTDDLLALSVAESQPAVKNLVALSELLRKVFEQMRPKAEDKGLDIKLYIDKDVSVLGDEAQLTQVLINLIDNALNYTHEGCVEVSLASDEEEARLQVKDTGIGISSEHLPRIFERFYRVDKGRSRVTGGTGLGLSIVRHIVEAHGGKVTVESVLNGGSEFTVRLPVG